MSDKAKNARGIVIGIEHHLNLTPATVQCDECGHQERAGYKYMPPEERTKVAEILREKGWIVKGDHEYHVCPTCRENA